jgi:guanylate kinase
LLDIDIQGGKKIHNNEIDCHFIFIDAPSIATLEERLVKRGTETPEVIQKRLNNAKKEIERGQELKFYHHITNDEVKKCFATVTAYIE